MADMYLHARIVEDLSQISKRDFNMDVLYLASQGPDPYFYIRSAESKAIGSIMHQSKVKEMFLNMTSLVKENLNIDTYSLLVGFISHHILDVYTHPYIFYYSGRYIPEDKSTQQYRALHKRFEQSMDVALIEKEHKIKAHKLDMSKLYFKEFNIPEAVLDVINKVTKKTYHIESADVDFLAGAQRFHRIAKNFIYDRFGFHKIFLSIVDIFAPKTDLFYKDLSYYHHLEKFDFLNEEKRTWHHPVTNKAFNFSVIELYEMAKDKLNQMISKLDEYLYNNQKIDLNTLYEDLSYETGLDLSKNQEMKYFVNYRKMRRK